MRLRNADRACAPLEHGVALKPLKNDRLGSTAHRERCLVHPEKVELRILCIRDLEIHVRPAVSQVSQDKSSERAK